MWSEKNIRKVCLKLSNVETKVFIRISGEDFSVIISLGDVVSWLKDSGFEEIQFSGEVPENIRKWIRHYHCQMVDGRHCHLLFHEGKSGIFTENVKFPEYRYFLRYDVMENRVSPVSAKDGKLADIDTSKFDCLPDIQDISYFFKTYGNRAGRCYGTHPIQIMNLSKYSAHIFFPFDKNNSCKQQENSMAA